MSSRQVACRLLTVLLAWLACCSSDSANAEELYLEFIRGLREHEHFEYVLAYLDELEARPDLPPEIREVLQYERGMTLLAQAGQFGSLDTQREYLDQASDALEEFVNTHAGHPLAGQANTDRATILLEKARVELWRSEELANEGNEEAFRLRAREFVNQAKEVFQAAFEQHKADFESYDLYIPPEEVELLAQRQAAEARYLHAMLSLAQCTYWLAHTYAKETPEYRDTLTTASVEFEKMYEAFRQQVIGQLARLWQGKCFEEQGELRPAIGIYDSFIDGNDAFETPGQTLAMLQMLTTAVHFKLICLNHDLRMDYQAAADLADRWLKNDNFRQLRRTESGMGIAYERARALEGYALTLETSNPLRNDSLNQALGLARSLNQHPGAYKMLTSRMIQRIMLALNRDPNDPQDFESAFGIAGQFLADIDALNAEIRQIEESGDPAQEETLRAKEESRRAAAVEMTRFFDLAIRLAKSNTDPRQLQLAHLRLAYGYVTQGKYYEAAAIAEWLMDKHAEEFPELAVDCGFVGVMAYDNAYTQAPVDNREFEAARLVDMGLQVEQRFPESPRANDCRAIIGKVFFNQGEHILAAEWFSKVPASAEMYGEAQLQAGQSYWRAYTEALALEEADRPPEAATWIDLAATHLATGITERQALLAPEVPTPDDLARAKLSLATLRISQGVYTSQGDVTGAIELLSSEPHSVIAAIRIGEGESRPLDQSIRSAQLASFALQQLLRAQIGAASEADGDARQQFLDGSADTRALLEDLAAEAGDEGTLTEIYIQFGAELKKELERLQETGERDRLLSVRAGFESFLDDVAARREGQTRSSLVWIAETFAALGESAADNDENEKAQSYFARAAGVYEDMLQRSVDDSNFASDEQVVLIQLQLARTHRRAGDYPKAEVALNEVLKRHADMIDVQTEAAWLYELWAGEEEDASKFQLAITGRNQDPEIWGWGKIARMRQGAMQQPDARPDAVESFLDAKVHQIDALLAYAATGDDEDHKIALNTAKYTVESLVMTTNPDILEPRMDDFERQYDEILNALGEPLVSLSDVRSVTATDAETIEEVEDDPLVSNNETDQKQDAGGSNWVMIVVMLLVGGGSLAGLCFLSVSQNRKRRRELAERRANRPQMPSGRAGVR